LPYQKTQAELNDDARNKARRLKRSTFAALRSLTIPSQFIALAAAIARASWFAIFSGTLFRELDARRNDLRQRLRAKYLEARPLNALELKLATRRFHLELFFRSLNIHSSWMAIGFLWAIGSTSQRIYQFFARLPPFKWVDASWRPAVFSLSFFALFAITVFAPIWEWTLFPAAESTEQATKRVQQPSTTLVFPGNELPVYWRLGSAALLQQGFDGAPLSISEARLVQAACTSSAVVVFGAAPGEGADESNTILARARARALANHLQAQLSVCDAPPRMLLAALSAPAASPDASQRRAFAVGLSQQAAEKLPFISLTDISTLLMANPYAYRRYDVCLDPCDWP
jgi:hypothetical protein